MGELDLVDEPDDAGDAGEGPDREDGDDAGFFGTGHLEAPELGEGEDKDCEVGDGGHDGGGYS